MDWRDSTTKCCEEAKNRNMQMEMKIGEAESDKMGAH